MKTKSKQGKQPKLSMQSFVTYEKVMYTKPVKVPAPPALVAWCKANRIKLSDIEPKLNKRGVVVGFELYDDGPTFSLGGSDYAMMSYADFDAKGFLTNAGWCADLLGGGEVEVDVVRGKPNLKPVEREVAELRRQIAKLERFAQQITLTAANRKRA